MDKKKYIVILHGKVSRGKGRGKKLGFPTANININNALPEGIYISGVEIRGKKYNALTFIGKAETFGEKDSKVESFLFDFNGNLYDNRITVNLIKKIRKNKKFDSVEDLIKQMGEDKKEAKEYFRNYV